MSYEELRKPIRKPQSHQLTPADGGSSSGEAEGGCRMERNKVYGLSTPNQAEGHIEMKKNVVYGITSDQDYENPK